MMKKMKMDWNKNWKKNLMAAAVLLVVCAGIYMNWMYSNTENVANLTDKLDVDKVMSENGIVLDGATPVNGDMENTVTDYFAAVRLSRQQARDSAVNLLQEAMAYGKDEKNEESNKKLSEIVETALQEAQIESLIIAKGYQDCVAYLSDGAISVAVASPEGGMKDEDVALVADIVMSQTGLKMEKIRVVEVQ